MDNEQSNIENKRLRILGDEEVENIYGRPCFTYEDRCNYFSLSHPEKELLQSLRSVKSKAYFILQLGYFKAKYQFYTFELHEVEEDLQYILKNHFNDNVIEDKNAIDKYTRQNQQKLILNLFNYRYCDAMIRQQLEFKACKAAAVCGKPIFIFREIMNYLYVLYKHF